MVDMVYRVCRKTYLEYQGLTYEVRRDDPNLIKVIKELGEESFGDFAHLKIVKVPSRLQYKIIDYDGYETVTEQFRTFN